MKYEYFRLTRMMSRTYHERHYHWAFRVSAQRECTTASRRRIVTEVAPTPGYILPKVEDLRGRTWSIECDGAYAAACSGVKVDDVDSNFAVGQKDLRLLCSRS